MDKDMIVFLLQVGSLKVQDFAHNVRYWYIFYLSSTVFMVADDIKIFHFVIIMTMHDFVNFVQHIQV